MLRWLPLQGEPIQLPFELRRCFGRWLCQAITAETLPPTFLLKRYELAQTFRRQGGEPPAPLSALQFDIVSAGGGGGSGGGRDARRWQQQQQHRAAEAECLLLAVELLAGEAARVAVREQQRPHGNVLAGVVVGPVRPPVADSVCVAVPAVRAIASCVSRSPGRDNDVRFSIPRRPPRLPHPGRQPRCVRGRRAGGRGLPP